MHATGTPPGPTSSPRSLKQPARYAFSEPVNYAYQPIMNCNSPPVSASTPRQTNTYHAHPRDTDGAFSLSPPPIRSFVAYGTGSVNARPTGNTINSSQLAAMACYPVATGQAGHNEAIVALLPPAGDDDYSFRDQSEWRSPETRVYPSHFCAWPNCCYILPSDVRTERAPSSSSSTTTMVQNRPPLIQRHRKPFVSPLHTSQIDHLPVCHERCWKAELARLMRESGGRVDCSFLPLCHRTCYLQKIFREQHDGSGKQVVPWARSWMERLRWHQFQHWISREVVSHGLC